MLPEPTTTAVAERIDLPRTLTEDLLQKLYREKLIEVEDAIRDWVDALRHVGPRLGSARAFAVSLRLRWTSAGVAPRLLAHDAAAVYSVEHGGHGYGAPGIPDLVLPESLLQTLGCVINSRRFAIPDRTTGNG